MTPPAFNPWNKSSQSTIGAPTALHLRYAWNQIQRPLSFHDFPSPRFRISGIPWTLRESQRLYPSQPSGFPCLSLCFSVCRMKFDSSAICWHYTIRAVMRCHSIRLRLFPETTRRSGLLSSNSSPCARRVKRNLPLRISLSSAGTEYGSHAVRCVHLN